MIIYIINFIQQNPIDAIIIGAVIVYLIYLWNDKLNKQDQIIKNQEHIIELLKKHNPEEDTSHSESQ